EEWRPSAGSAGAAADHRGEARPGTRPRRPAQLEPILGTGARDRARSGRRSPARTRRRGLLRAPPPAAPPVLPAAARERPEPELDDAGAALDEAAGASCSFVREPPAHTTGRPAPGPLSRPGRRGSDAPAAPPSRPRRPRPRRA